MLGWRTWRVASLGVVLAWAAVFAHVSIVAAECTRLDPWPSFVEAARTANRIVVGEVVENFSGDSASNAIEFRVRVDEVLRGESPPTIDFRGGTRSGAPLTVCPGDSILRVHVGNVLAFAFGARVASSPNPVLAVAWIRGTPDVFLMPGAEKLSLARVLQLAALPSTDSTQDSVAPASTGFPVLPLVAGALSLVVLLVRPRRRST